MNNWPQAFVFAIVFLACAIVLASYAPALSQGRIAGFMIASDGDSFVWRVNTFTGEVSYCVRRDNSKDIALIERRAPICSKASAPIAPIAQ